MRRCKALMLATVWLVLAAVQPSLAGRVRLALGDAGWPAWAKAVYIGGEVYQGSEFFFANGTFTAHIDLAYGDFTVPVVVKAGEDTVVHLPLPRPFDQAEFRRLASEKGDIWRWNRFALTYAVVQEKARHREFRNAVADVLARVAKETGGLFRFSEAKDAARADLVFHLVTEREIAPQFPQSASVPAGYVDPRPCYWFFTRVDLYIDVRYCLDLAVLKHEVGHGLGLMGHSSRPTALMFETSTASTAPVFSPEEVTALKVLYSLKAGEGVVR
ncbi:MAG: hypothetical protein ACM3RP_00780 [Chitinophagales bacterium]